MNIIISGKHLDIGDTLRNYAENNIRKVVTKYFESAINAHATMYKHNNNSFHTSITVNEGVSNSIIIKSDNESHDAYHSVDGALVKIEKQLRRYKERIKNHHKRKQKHSEIFSATKYILSPSDEQGSEPTDELEMPAIIAEKPATIETLSVGDAVMKMDMLNLPTLLFINNGSRTINVVYYRKDGNISWLNTKIAVQEFSIAP